MKKMKTITKNFVEIRVPADCEARKKEWITTEETFEEWAKKVTAYGYGPYAVREVKKIFNPETFEITIKVIRKKEGML